MNSVTKKTKTSTYFNLICILAFLCEECFQITAYATRKIKGKPIIVSVHTHTHSCTCIHGYCMRLNGLAESLQVSDNPFSQMVGWAKLSALKLLNSAASYPQETDLCVFNVRFTQNVKVLEFSSVPHFKRKAVWSVDEARSSSMKPQCLPALNCTAETTSDVVIFHMLIELDHVIQEILSVFTLLFVIHIAFAQNISTGSHVLQERREHLEYPKKMHWHGENTSLSVR